MRTQPTVDVVSFVKARRPTPTVMITMELWQVSADFGKVARMVLAHPSR